MNAYCITNADDETLYYAANSSEDAITAHDRDWSPKAVSCAIIPDDQLDTMNLAMTDEEEVPTDETMTFREFMADNAHETSAYQIGDNL